MAIFSNKNQSKNRFFRKLWLDKILIIIFGILIILAFNFFQKEIKTFFYTISSPIQKSLWQTGDVISDFFGGMVKTKDQNKENEELRLKIQELSGEKAELKDLEQENEILREALRIGLQKDFKLSLAEVISKDISQDFVLINKGSRDGILKDMPAITQQKVLCGKVSEVYEKFSRVMLLSDKKNSFDVKIMDKEIYGLIEGEGNLRLFLDFIPQGEDLREGDLVVTTQLSKIFPKGLLVGQVKEVLKGDIESFQQAEIESTFKIKDGQILFIILDY